MKFSKPRAALAALLFLTVCGGLAAYFKYKKVSNYVISQISGQAAKRLGRQVKFGHISFSPLSGVVIEDACVSRKPDFSKGDFFCAAKTIIKPEFAALMKNRIYFSKVTFEHPVMKVRESKGVWDFADLIALLPQTDKGLYLTWNASELVMTDAALEAEMGTSGLSMTLEHAALRLTHYSSYGGNYGLSASGLLKSALKGKLLQAEVGLEADANFDYGGLSSTKGVFTARNAAFGAITLQGLRAGWSVFNVRKPLAEKNYSLSLEAEQLLIPGAENSVRAGVSKGLELFSAVAGRTAPKIEDIEVPELKAALTLKDSVLYVKDVSMRANFLNLDASLRIDGPAKKADAEVKAETGGHSLGLSASGPMSAPEIKPLMSSALAARLKDALAGIESGLLKFFPVTGD